MPTLQQVPQSIVEEFDWVPNASVTHMEIINGAYLSKNPNAVFFFRKPDFLSALPEKFQKQFSDTDTYSVAALAALKEKVRARFGAQQVKDYDCQFAKIDDLSGAEKVALNGLESLSDEIYKFLTAAISKQYPLSSHTPSLVETALAPHKQVLTSLPNTVLGRDAEVELAIKFVREAAPPDGAPLLIFTGPSGCGKTTLAASIANKTDQFGRVLFFSTDAGMGGQSVHQLMQLIVLLFGSKDAVKKAENKDVLEGEIASMCQETLEACPASKKSTIIIVDGYQALQPLNQQVLVSWLPERCKGSLRIILTSTPDSARYLREDAKKAVREEAIRVLPTEIRSGIVKETFGVYNKKLDPDQMTSLVGNEGSANMLWLAIACEELRQFGVFEAVTERIKKLNSSTSGLLQQIIARLIAEDASGSVKQALVLVAISARGLSERELMDLLGTQSNPGPDRVIVPMAMALWAPLFASIRFLLRSSTSGDSAGLLKPRNRSVQDVVTEMVSGGIETALRPHHLKLANYFEHCSDRSRKLDEYPVQLMAARETGRLVGFVRSADFEVMPYHTRRTLVDAVRCRTLLGMADKPRPERLCMGCCTKHTFNTRLPNKMCCCLCGSPTFSAASVQPGALVALKNNEALAVRCRSHNPKAFMGPNNAGANDCLLCKIPVDSKAGFPAVVCSACALMAASRCCHVLG